jgi:hypothetical protein
VRPLDRAAGFICIVLAALLPAATLAGEGGGQHTGSAQPFQGFFKLSPIVLRNGSHTLLVDSAVKFYDAHKNLVTSPKSSKEGEEKGAGKGGEGRPLDTDSQKLVNYKIYNDLLLLWYGRGSNLSRDEVAAVIKATIDGITEVNAVEQVVFIKYSVQ